MVFKSKNTQLFRYFWTIAFFGWAAILLILSVLPSTDIITQTNEASRFRLDYLEHFIVFMIFGLLFGFWRRDLLQSRNRETHFFLFFGGIYAASTELVQIVIESRSFNPADLYFNLGGLLLGTAITRIYIFK